MTNKRLNHFLIRHGYHYTGSNWTEGHLKWIQQLEFSDRNLQNVLSCYQNEIKFLEMQLGDLDKEIQGIAQSEEYDEKVKALCAYRGIGVLTAMIIISEVIDFSRFSNPRELMAYLGMVPSEYSSGPTVRKGSITKCCKLQGYFPPRLQIDFPPPSQIVFPLGGKRETMVT